MAKVVNSYRRSPVRDEIMRVKVKQLEHAYHRDFAADLVTSLLVNLITQGLVVGRKPDNSASSLLAQTRWQRYFVQASSRREMDVSRETQVMTARIEPVVGIYTHSSSCSAPIHQHRT